MARLTIRNLSKTFGKGMRVLDDISLDVASGEFLTLLGPSGCGKTTLLKAIAGFHPISSGQLLIDGKDVTDLPPEKRDTSMCFQSYALFPHMSVAENILFGPKQSGLGRAECAERLANALRQVDLGAHQHKLPAALSGGQQQRVALARAMAMRPGIVLFDEPLSNLDAKLREQVRFEMRALQGEHGFTAIYVTHDQAEALAMSDRIVVLNGGRIEQIGSPAEIYDTPVNRIVADFIGAANILTAEILGVNAKGWQVRTELGLFEVQSPRAPQAARHYLCWRPEDIEEVSASDPPQGNEFTAEVIAQAFQGNVTDVLIRAGECGGRESGAGENGPSQRIQIRRPVAADAKLRLRIDPKRFCFLEPL